MIPSLETHQWALGAAAAFLVGVAKMGVPGLGILVVPLMVLAVGDARQSAGWLLPILWVGDVFAVIAWRRHAAAGSLFTLIPWVVAGMACGAAALSFDERTLRIIVGAVVTLMLAAYIVRRHRPGLLAAGARSAPYGVVAGFATTVANAAGPVMNLYLLSRKLSKEEFVATGAWFFLIINLAKGPIYLWHDLISAQSLAFDATLAPAVLAGAVTGRWLLRQIDPSVFEAIVVAFTGLAVVMLFR